MILLHYKKRVFVIVKASQIKKNLQPNQYVYVLIYCQFFNKRNKLAINSHLISIYLDLISCNENDEELYQ